jgi:hypothetical protein
MSFLDRLERLLLHINPTNVRTALLLLNCAVVAFGVHLQMPANERWD